MAAPKRARDIDRNAVVAALSEAYVDGQLDAAEREERTATALAATHVDQLGGLIADLRGDAVDAAAAQLATKPAPRRTAPSAGTSTGPSTSSTTSTTRTSVTVTTSSPRVVRKRRSARTRRLVTLVVTVLLLVGAGLGVRHLVGPDEHDETVAEQKAQLVSIDDVHLTPEEPDTGDGTFAERPRVALKGLTDWAPDEAHVTTLLQQWRAAKGAYVTNLRFDENGASITIPVAASTPRTEQWTVTAADPGAPYLWIRDGSLERDADVIDLRDLDVPRLFDNIGRGIAELDVEEAVLGWVGIQLDASTQLPTVDIWIDNAFGEVGWMSTTLSGHVLEEHPFDRDR